MERDGQWGQQDRERGTGPASNSSGWNPQIRINTGPTNRGQHNQRNSFGPDRRPDGQNWRQDNNNGHNYNNGGGQYGRQNNSYNYNNGGGQYGRQNSSNNYNNGGGQYGRQNTGYNNSSNGYNNSNNGYSNSNNNRNGPYDSQSRESYQGGQSGDQSGSYTSSNHNQNNSGGFRGGLGGGNNSSSQNLDRYSGSGSGSGQRPEHETGTRSRFSGAQNYTSENTTNGEPDMQVRQPVRRQEVEERDQIIRNIQQPTEDMRMPTLLPRPPTTRKPEWEGRTRLATQKQGRSNDRTGEEEDEPPPRSRRF